MADEDPHAKHRAMMQKKAEPAAEFADIDLRDGLLLNPGRRGSAVRHDVIGDNIVVMDFVYTTCTTVCPVLTALFTQVQTKLGDDLGNERDAGVNDRRRRPRHAAATQGLLRKAPVPVTAGLWLTGPKSIVDDVLTGVGAYSDEFRRSPGDGDRRRRRDGRVEAHVRLSQPRSHREYR